MTWSLEGWRESIDTAVLANIAALTSQSVRFSGDDISVPAGFNQLMGVFAFGVSMTQARLRSRSLERVLLPDIEPLNRGAEPLTPTPFYDSFDRPVALDADESLNAEIAEDGVTTVNGVLVLLGNGITPIPAGPIHTVRATAAITLAAGAWTFGALTFSQSLGAGRYAVVGMRAQSAGLVAARLVFVGGGVRPGVIGYDADEDVELQRFRFGRCGLLGEFGNLTPPGVEYLSESADTAEVVHLDLIKVA